MARPSGTRLTPRGRALIGGGAALLAVAVAATLVATLSVLMCLYLMLNLTGDTWIRFLAWMALGCVVYAVYGRRHSRLGRTEQERSTNLAP